MKAKLNSEIGARIRETREFEGITQKKLAELMGVTAQYISNLERGTVGMSLQTLIKLCECLHITSDYILMGKPVINEISIKYQRLEHLPDKEKKMIDRGINLMLEVMNL